MWQLLHCLVQNFPAFKRSVAAAAAKCLLHPCCALAHAQPQRPLQQPDRTGRVSTDKLRATIREFELLIDVDRLIKEVSMLTSSF